MKTALPAICALLLCSTLYPARAEAEALKVVATNFPAYDFAREIAGERARVLMLLPPGGESHSFEPAPRDIIAIRNCDLFIHTGGNSDRWTEKILASLDTGGIRVLKMIELVNPLEEEVTEGMDTGRSASGGHETDVPEYDEHVWTAPLNACLIVQALARAFAELDPEHAACYQDNSAAYLQKLRALDAELRALTANAARRTVIFADRFPFRYLAAAYDLRYYAAFPGCSAETDAGAATVAFLINKIKTEKIPVVFHMEFSNEKMADAISEDTGAKKLLLHACHNISKADFESGAGYLSIMRRNAAKLKEALW
ncbi:MAG: metal ABC transporter substrate-binding protein [Desulfovibrionaceae bacterium]|nr:metal ABC transporter substrate-binding protein [Desulfovibrionaceae bacterium]